MDTHNLTVDFGRHKGELYTRIPINYLKWMVNSNHSKANIAQAELDRRGIRLNEELEISGHAIDRASLRYWEIFVKREYQSDGFHTWLYSLAKKALKYGIKEKQDRIVYQGITFVFENDSKWPILKTVL